MLLQIIGVGPQLAELEKEEKELYQERLYVGRTADQKEKFAKEQPYYPEAPRDLVLSILCQNLLLLSYQLRG